MREDVPVEGSRPDENLSANRRRRQVRRRRRRARLRSGALRTKEVLRVAYRDPDHISERLSLFAAEHLGEPSRKWAEAARRARPRATTHELAESQRRASARIARIDGAISGTPFFAALVPGYASYLWQETRMALRMAALYGKDPGSLRTAAEVLFLRGVHPSIEAAEAAILAVAEQPPPPPVTSRRSLKSWFYAIRRILILGGFIGPAKDDQHSHEVSHARLRAIAGLIAGVAIWVITWILPLTFMIAMAWGCEAHLRSLGRRAIVHWSGENTIRSAHWLHGASRRPRDVIRGGALALSIAVPVAFVVYADRDRQTVGIDWLGALGGLVALSLVIAMTIVGSRQLAGDDELGIDDD